MRKHTPAQRADRPAASSSREEREEPDDWNSVIGRPSCTKEIISPDAVRDVREGAQQQAEGAAFAIYLILDPTQPDPLGQFEALPIYVGLSSNVGRRVEKHFRRAALKKLDGHLVCGRMRELMRQDILAGFVVVDRYEDEIDAKIAETVFAQLLLQAGYRLYNLWPSQSQILSAKRLDKAIAAIRRRPAARFNNDSGE